MRTLACNLQKPDLSLPKIEFGIPLGDVLEPPALHQLHEIHFRTSSTAEHTLPLRQSLYNCKIPSRQSDFVVRLYLVLRAFVALSQFRFQISHLNLCYSWHQPLEKATRCLFDLP